MCANYKGFNIVPVIGQPDTYKIPGVRFGRDTATAKGYGEAYAAIDRYIEINPTPLKDIF